MGEKNQKISSENTNVMIRSTTLLVAKRDKVKGRSVILYKVDLDSHLHLQKKQTLDLEKKDPMPNYIVLGKSSYLANSRVLISNRTDFKTLA